MAYRPKHFKVHVSIRNHTKTAEMFGNNDLLATYLRIGLLAIERFADRNGGEFTIHKSELPALTGRKRSDSARVVLDYLVSTSPVLVKYCGDTCRITVPNLRKKQGFSSEAVSKLSTPSSSSSSPTSSPLREREEPPPSAPASVSVSPEGNKTRKARNGSKSIETRCPNVLEAHDRELLLAWAKSKGFSESEVKWAWNFVRDWSLSNNKRKADWVACTRNAMRDGWGLRGYHETEEERYQRELAASPVSPANEETTDAQ